MGYVLVFIAGGMAGVWAMCVMIEAGRADERDERMLQQREIINCGRCKHADSKCLWCRLLDMPIDEDRFCYWADTGRETE